MFMMEMTKRLGVEDSAVLGIKRGQTVSFDSHERHERHV